MLHFGSQNPWFWFLKCSILHTKTMGFANQYDWVCKTIAFSLYKKIWQLYTFRHKSSCRYKVIRIF